MKNRKKIGMPRFNTLFAKDEEGEGGGGGTTFTQADIDAAVTAAQGDVSGLKTKNQELLDAQNDLKTKLKNWDGMEPDKVRGMLDAFEKDEVLKLHAEGNHDAAYDKRMEKERSTWESKLDAATSSSTTEKDRADKLELQVRDLVIDQQVLTSFVSEKGLETAAPDVVLRAKAAFKIEEGVPIARDSDGKIINGASGPITISEWVSGLKQTAGHLFPGSQGAGAEGAGAGGAGSDLDAQMKAAADSNDMVLYGQLKDKKKALAAA